MTHRCFVVVAESSEAPEQKMWEAPSPACLGGLIAFSLPFSDSVPFPVFLCALLFLGVGLVKWGVGAVLETKTFRKR